LAPEAKLSPAAKRRRLVDAKVAPGKRAGAIMEATNKVITEVAVLETPSRGKGRPLSR
jgi:hypothetical protein